MASAIYPLAKKAFLSGSINLTSDTIKVAVVNTSTDYTYSSSHQYLSSVTAYSGTTAQPITSPSVTNGVYSSGVATVTFSAVSASSGKTIGALVIYKDTGTASTSPVIAYVDGFTAITPNGGSITITWDTGSNKIFALN